MFSCHWKTVMFGFAPKQCTPFKMHNNGVFQTSRENMPIHPIYASSPQTHPSAQKLVPGIAPDFSFIFLFHLVASLCASDCDSNSSSVASKKAAYTSYIPLPPMSLIGHNLSLGLEQGSIDLVSASRNTVLHSCRF